MAAAFEHAHDARTALHAIVSDPAHGQDALLSSQTIASLLSDFLPDAPRESGLLIAAVSKDVPANLRQHAAHGLDATTAIRLAASSFAASTAYSPDACLWAAGELALAMGLARASDLPADVAMAGAGDLPADVAVPGAGSLPADAAVPRIGARPPVAGQGEPATVGSGGLADSPGQNLAGPAAPAASPSQTTARPDEPGFDGRPTLGGEAIPGAREPALRGDPAVGAFAARTAGAAVAPADPTAPAGEFPGAGARTADRGALPGRRLRTSTFALVGVIIVLVAGAAAAGAALVISNLSSSSTPPAAGAHGSAGTSRTNPVSSPANPVSSPASPVASVAGPAAAVRAYIAAVNQHDWPKVWRLGGKNLGESYQQLVAGYRLTSRVVITSLTTNGDAVYVRVLAYETTGAVQTYALSYLVTDGIIVAGQSTLVSG